MIDLKDIPTEKLVKELSSRFNVKKECTVKSEYTVDHIWHGWISFDIYEAYSLKTIHDFFLSAAEADLKDAGYKIIGDIDLTFEFDSDEEKVYITSVAAVTEN